MHFFCSHRAFDLDSFAVAGRRFRLHLHAWQSSVHLSKRVLRAVWDHHRCLSRLDPHGRGGHRVSSRDESLAGTTDFRFRLHRPRVAVHVVDGVVCRATAGRFFFLGGVHHHVCVGLLLVVVWRFSFRLELERNPECHFSCRIVFLDSGRWILAGSHGRFRNRRSRLLR